MALDYPDNRQKFKDIALWDIASLTPRATNPVPAGVRRVEPAIRGTVAPRDRITEIRNPTPVPEPAVTSEPAPDAVPNPEDWTL